jgi:hypothetical protein
LFAVVAVALMVVGVLLVLRLLVRIDLGDDG